MTNAGSDHSSAQLQVIEALIVEGVKVDCDIVQIDPQTWALHASIAVDGEVIVAEFDTRGDAETALQQLWAAAEDRNAP